MPFNGSGTFNRIYSWAADKAASINITASRMDTDTGDIVSSGLDNALTRDGQGIATANLPMGGFKHTGAGIAAARSDYATYGQQQDGIVNWVAAGGTSDAITATYSPALTALVDGQLCCFRASAANTTTTPTFAPSGLTAHTITKAGGAALLAGDIPAALAEVVLRYDVANTRWELLNPAVIAAGATIASPAISGATLSGTTTLSGGVTATGETITGGTFAAPAFSGTLSGTYTLGGTPTLGATLTATGQTINGGTLAGPTITGPTISGTVAGSPYFSGAPTFGSVSSGLNAILNVAFATTIGIGINDAAHTSGDGFMQFFTNGSLIGSVTNSSNTGVLYNTTSDARLKLDVTPLGDVGAIIDGMKPSAWTWRSSGARGVGFVAQELIDIVPDAVTPGDDDPGKRPGDEGFRQWGMDATQLVPYLVAEIQSLRARLARLEDDHVLAVR